MAMSSEQARATNKRRWSGAFYENVIVGDGCWVWDGNIRDKGRSYGDGYGVFNRRYAHRIIYELLVGPIPPGLTLDHLCRNTRCVNPDHLEPVTNKENSLRGFGLPAKNARKAYCIRGHPFDESYRNARRCGTCSRAKARERYYRNKARAQGKP